MTDSPRIRLPVASHLSPREDFSYNVLKCRIKVILALTGQTEQFTRGTQDDSKANWFHRI
jgi:hypothetical protein